MLPVEFGASRPFPEKLSTASEEVLEGLSIQRGEGGSR